MRVTEIFHSIQGESTHAGRPCTFVRLTGCGLRCAWCDTAYAFSGGETMTIDAVVERAESFGCRLVEITGGEPLEQPEVLPLMARLCDLGYEVLLETGGHVDIGPVDPRVRRIMDVKCPGSGMSGRNRMENLDLLTAEDEAKFVIAGEDDYHWAARTVRTYGLDRRCPVLFAPAYGAVANRDLATWILRDRLPVRFQLQVHKYIWPPDARGV